MLRGEGVLVRVRTYGFAGFYEASGTSTRNQPSEIDRVEACRPQGFFYVLV